MQYIESNLDEEFSLEDLAKIAFFSRFHFHRIFRGMTGETVMGYIRRLRFERAAEALQQSDHSVTDIAFDAGYESLEGFIRAFGDYYGCSPTHYRKKSKISTLSTKIYVNNNIKEIDMNVTMTTLPTMKIAYVRHVGPYNECESAWGTLFKWAYENGLVVEGAKIIGICHDDPGVTAPEKIRYDACITVGDDVEGEGDVSIKEISSGSYAMALHVGPYEKVSDTYSYICGQWAPKHGKEIKGESSIEIYLNDPHKTRPEDLKTEVYVPVG